MLEADSTVRAHLSPRCPSLYPGLEDKVGRQGVYSIHAAGKGGDPGIATLGRFGQPSHRRWVLMTPFQKAVRKTVSRIPRGKVTSYGAVAAMAGQPRAARGVGWILHSLGPDTELPWWRVVNRNGRLSTRKLPGPAGHLQRDLLEKEGVTFDATERVSDEAFWWRPDLD
jgi:methylated-DNA-protein-cysteine methyltransferase-like protein